MGARATPPDASAWISVFECWTRATDPHARKVLRDLKDRMLAEILADRGVTVRGVQRPDRLR